MATELLIKVPVYSGDFCMIVEKKRHMKKRHRKKAFRKWQKKNLLKPQIIKTQLLPSIIRNSFDPIVKLPKKSLLDITV